MAHLLLKGENAKRLVRLDVVVEKGNKFEFELTGGSISECG